MTLPVWMIVLIVLAVVIITAVLTALWVRHKDISKVAYMMDALEDGELNFRFRDNSRFNRTLNRIRTIFEKQHQAYEQESWTRLIRVLTHEIMNTVSPIASLSDALVKSLDDNGHSSLDLKAGLATIAESSDGLMKFVETYRELTGVARSVRKAVPLEEMVTRVIQLSSEQLARNGATCTYNADGADLLLYADAGQLQRVFINLLSNALQAGAKHVRFYGYMEHDEVVLTVSNDGVPIPVSNQEQIFVPFYTTKPDGSGIGLAVARTILRQHDATISLLESNEQRTVFQLRFR